MKIQPDAPARDFLSIGHSNIPAEHFLALLHSAGVDVVADVRSVPQSRFCPWFSQRPLAAMLIAAGIGYSPMGEALGGRPRHDRLYRDGVADYEAMAIESDYVAGLDRLLDVAARARVCLMCAEARTARLSPLFVGCAQPRRTRHRYRPHLARWRDRATHHDGNSAADA